jgi:hypothetical protein
MAYIRVGRKMDDIETTLRQLNENTFRAEAKDPADSWREYLHSVLAEDFVLRRSRAEAENETRDDMIARIDETREPVKRTIVPPVHVWSSGTLGVVASVITLPDETGAPKAYQNVKVFVPEGADLWRCVYWQVTARPVPTADSP